MWYCYVTELHVYDFVIKNFIIKRDVICARPWMLNEQFGTALSQLNHKPFILHKRKPVALNNTPKSEWGPVARALVFRFPAHL